MISDTSRAAFERIKPKITRSQDKVLQIIRAHSEGLTDAEIKYYLGWTINRVTRTLQRPRSRQKIVLTPAFEKEPEAQNSLFQ